MWRGCRSFLLPYRYGCLHELALARSRFCTRKRFTSFIRCEEQHRVLDAILHFFHSLFNPDGLRELIRAGGAPLICTIVFIETGFFVGFFLPVAGAAKMSYASYLAFDIFGGIFWVGAMILGGFSLGRSVPNIGERIHYVIAVVIVVSVLPAVISIYRSRHKFSAANDRGVTTPRAEGK